MSILLFFGTFLIAFQLKKAKTSNFFPAAVKNFISDFAVIIAILAMTLTDFLVGVDTPKLNVPGEFQPTSSKRGWLINPVPEQNPWWTVIVAIVPAILGTILIFIIFFVFFGFLFGFNSLHLYDEFKARNHIFVFMFSHRIL